MPRYTYSHNYGHRLCIRSGILQSGQELKTKDAKIFRDSTPLHHYWCRLIAMPSNGSTASTQPSAHPKGYWTSQPRNLCLQPASIYFSNKFIRNTARLPLKCTKTILSSCAATGVQGSAIRHHNHTAQILTLDSMSPQKTPPSTPPPATWQLKIPHLNTPNRYKSALTHI